MERYTILQLTSIRSVISVNYLLQYCHQLTQKVQFSFSFYNTPLFYFQTMQFNLDDSQVFGAQNNLLIHKPVDMRVNVITHNQIENFFLALLSLRTKSCITL